MITQRVENPPPRGWRGVVLVLAVAGAVVLASEALQRLGQIIGGVASILFFAFGGAVAWLLLDRFVLAYVYTCDASCLRLYRAYGRYRRPMQEVWLSSLRASGSLEDMRRRFPDARVQRAVRDRCDIAPLAVVWLDGGRPAILVLQPDAALRAAIERAVKR